MLTLTKVGQIITTRCSARHTFHTDTIKCQLPKSAHEKFIAAKQKLDYLNVKPSNDVKLKMYGLYKQATMGKNTTSKPGDTKFIDQMKWATWRELGDMSKVDAVKAYVSLVNEISKEGSKNKIDTIGTMSESNDDILNETGNQIMTVSLNRPQRYNAMTKDMYEGIIKLLDKASVDDSVSVVVLTGKGKFFCSGNDLKNFANITPETLPIVVKESAEMLERYISTFIDFPKPLIAAVNGPAVGIPVTQLGLFDAVYASDKATFQTPFTKLGQSPEACSSYTFPKLMGHAKASRMLLFNEMLTAEEAERVNLVTRVFPSATFQKNVGEEVEKITKLPMKSLIYSKRLMRDSEKDSLLEVCKAECERLVERWSSEDCMKAIMGFMTQPK